METLEAHFARLSTFLKDIGVRSWDRVLFVEDFYVSSVSRVSVNENRLQTIEQFSERFELLITKGYSWINLSGTGILTGALLVGIEKPTENAGTSFTSVNISGPFEHVKDNNYDLEKFVKMEK